MNKIKVDLPGRAEGDRVEIDGLGFFENGSAYSLKDEEVQAFIAKHAKVTYERNPETGGMIVKREELTFEELIELVPGVTIAAKNTSTEELPSQDRPVVIGPSETRVLENDDTEGGDQ